MNRILPRTARETDFGHLVPTFLLTDDSANELLCFLVWPLQSQQWVFLCNCLVSGGAGGWGYGGMGVWECGGVRCGGVGVWPNGVGVWECGGVRCGGVGVWPNGVGVWDMRG